jgi:hypothetical protein
MQKSPTKATVSTECLPTTLAPTILGPLPKFDSPQVSTKSFQYSPCPSLVVRLDLGDSDGPVPSLYKFNKPNPLSMLFIPCSVKNQFATLRPTKCTILFLTYFYYNTTLNIPTCFDPHRIITNSMVSMIFKTQSTQTTKNNIKPDNY